MTEEINEKVDQPLKKKKVEHVPYDRKKHEKLKELKKNETMVVKFQGENEETSTSLPNVDIPLDTSNIQLERLVNELLQNKNKVPYSFYINSKENEPVEIIGTIRDVVETNELGTENLLSINYKPLSLFRVNPVTRCTEELPGHNEAILHVSFSPDGENLASGGGDTVVRFWDVSTKTPKFTCKEHKNHVLCTTWSPDGRIFASGDKSGVILLWDPNTGLRLNRPLIGHKGYISSLVFEPLHKSKTRCRLLSGSKDGVAKLWNVTNGRLIMTLTNHTDAVEAIKWGGEGLIYTASRDKTINVWAERDENDPHFGNSPFKLIRVLKGHGHRINSLALSTDYLCRIGSYNHLGSLMNKKQQLYDDTKIYPTFTSDKEAATWRYNFEKKKESSNGLPFERLVSCSDDFTLFFWHPTVSAKPIKRLFGHQQPVTHINFSPNGRYLASASFDKKIKLWCGITGNFITSFVGHVDKVYQVIFSPDSRLLASASADSTLKIWEIRSSKKAKNTLAEHFDEVYALDWSPNGQLISSGGKDRLLRIWTE